MGTIKNYFFRDMGTMLGRSMRHVMRSRDAMITVSIIIMPIAFLLLLLYVSGSIIQSLEELFLVTIGKKRGNKWER